MIVRRFRDAGIVAVQQYLAAGRENPKTPFPTGLLDDEALTEVVEPRLEVERRSFKTRGEAAEFLARLLKPLPDAEVSADAGLWTWLAMYFFDEICPVNDDGGRTIRNDYHYVYSPKNALHYYRHLLQVAWRILKVAPKHNRLLLSNSLASLDKVTEVIMRGLYVARIPCVFEVLDRLYWDDSKGRARPGIASSNRVKRGDLQHRFMIRLRQLEKTYDLFSLNADQLIEILGDEFHEPQATPTRRVG